MSNHSIIALCNNIASRCNGGGYPESMHNPVIHLLQALLSLPLPGEQYQHNEVQGGLGDAEPPAIEPDGDNAFRPEFDEH